MLRMTLFRRNFSLSLQHTRFFSRRDVSQRNILDKFKDFLEHELKKHKLKNRKLKQDLFDKEEIERILKYLYEGNGQCVGFSSVWNHGKWLSAYSAKQKAIKNPLEREDSAWFDKVRNLLADEKRAEKQDYSEQERHAIMRLIRKIIHFQKNVFDFAGAFKKYRQPYATVSSISFAADMISTPIAFQHMLTPRNYAYLFSHNHTMSVFNDGSKWVFYNSSSPFDEVSTKNYAVLAKYVLFGADKHFEMRGHAMPLTIQTFSFTGVSPGATEGLTKLISKVRSPIIQIPEYNNLTPFLIAARDGSLDSLRFYIEEGVDVNEEDIDGITALWFAILWKQTAIIEELCKHDKVNVNLVFGGRTPLMYAVEKGQIETVKCLLERSDIDLSFVNCKGETVLDIVKRCHFEMQHVFEKLENSRRSFRF